eukprot:7390687-Prymnesium_polylepis.1
MPTPPSEEPPFEEQVTDVAAAAVLEWWPRVMAALVARKKLVVIEVSSPAEVKDDALLEELKGHTGTLEIASASPWHAVDNGAKWRAYVVTKDAGVAAEIAAKLQDKLVHGAHAIARAITDHSTTTTAKAELEGAANPAQRLQSSRRQLWMPPKPASRPLLLLRPRQNKSAPRVSQL